MKNRIIKKAWTLYDKWRKEITYCPAFKSNVRISLKGWKHITGETGKGKKRPIKDIYRRLMLLPYAKQIIKNSTTIQNITVKNKRKYYALEAVVKIQSRYKKIRTVFIEDKKKNKIFLSVMDKNIKSQ